MRLDSAFTGRFPDFIQYLPVFYGHSVVRYPYEKMPSALYRFVEELIIVPFTVANMQYFYSIAYITVRVFHRLKPPVALLFLSAGFSAAPGSARCFFARYD
jgi:hypothetical protein